MSLDRRLRQAADELRTEWERRPVPGPERPVRYAPAVGLGLVLALTAVVFVWSGTRPGPHGDEEPAVTLPAPDESIASTTTMPAETTSTADTARPAGPDARAVPAPGWEDLGRLPAPRYHALLFDVGDALVVFGGNRDLYADPSGALFDPVWTGIAVDHATGRIRDLPHPPLCDNGRPAGVWTGTELVIWQVAGNVLDECPPAAAYDPSTGRWRTIDDEFFREAGSQTVWTGEELVSATAGLAYRLDDGTTRRIPSVRDSDMFTGSRLFSPPTVHWTGDEILALGSEGVIRLDPATGSLVEGPAPPIPDRARASVWTGSELLAVNYDLEAAVFDPESGTWTAVDSMPLRFSECAPDTVAGDGLALVGWCSGIAVWDGTGDWTLLPLPVLEGNSWFGRRVLAGGYVYQVGSHVVRRPLPERDDGRTVQGGFFPLGAGYLDTPDEWRVTGTFADFGADAGASTLDSVSADLAGPDGATCRVSSTYRASRYAPVGTDPAELTRVRDGATIPIGQNPQGSDGLARVVIDQGNGSDLFDVACPTLEDARLLAAHLWNPGPPTDTLPPGVSGDGICDVVVTTGTRTEPDETAIAIELRLVETEPCEIDRNLVPHLSVSGDEGSQPDIDGDETPVDLSGHTLAPDAPYLTVTFAFRNWCDDRPLYASVEILGQTYGWIGQVTAPCLDPDGPASLTLVGIDGPGADSTVGP